MIKNDQDSVQFEALIMNTWKSLKAKTLGRGIICKIGLVIVLYGSLRNMKDTDCK